MRTLQVAAIGALLAVGVVARASIPQANPPVAATDTSLRSIACPSEGSCIAVGLTGSKYTVRVPLTARSADGSWSVEALPGTTPAGDSLLASVACSASSRCVAVGRQEVPATFLGSRSAGDRPVTQSWDGSAWRADRAVVPPGTADAELRGVDCVAATCMAVGSYAPRLGDDRPLAEAWKGSAWVLRLPPRIRTGHESSDGVLSDVACTAESSCVAVGRFGYDLTFFTGVAPLIQRWDGSGWRTERSANTRSLDTELNGVSCPSPDRCVAVGLQRNRPGIYGPFAETWDGDRWSVVKIAGPARSPDAELLDVACSDADRCVAVGFWATGTRFLPLIEMWDGRRWTIVPFDVPPDFSSSTLNSVSCPARRSCHAVGAYARDTPLLHAFSVSVVDGHPTVVRVPDA